MLPWSKGSFQHEDSAGHAGDINPGDLQWMTAGRGILHAEMPKGREEAHGLQMWVDLKSSDRMCEPECVQRAQCLLPSATAPRDPHSHSLPLARGSYQEHLAKGLTHAERDGVRAVVIAGSALGKASPVRTRTPTEFVHFTMAPGARLEHPVPEGFNAVRRLAPHPPAIALGAPSPA